MGKKFGKNFKKSIKAAGKILQKEVKKKQKRGKKIYKKLSPEEKEDLLSYLSSAIYKAEKEGATYRYVLYDVLDLEPSAYTSMQLSGFLDIHNAMVEQFDEDNA